MYYDPKLDRSEEAGWKKWCDEEQPTEEEQVKWSKISLLFSAKLGALAFLLEG
jgi:hypothetical protein